MRFYVGFPIIINVMTIYVNFSTASLKLDILPNTDIYVLVNTSFRIKCIVSQPINTLVPSILQVQRCFQNQTCADINPSSTEVIKRNGSSSLERIYAVQYAQILDEGVYNCRYGRQNSTVYPKVYVIEKPILPNNLSCTSINGNDLTCHWPEVHTRIATNYTGYFIKGHSNVITKCVPRVQLRCTWEDPSDTDKSVSRHDTFNITIVGNNFMTSNSKSYTIYFPEIVKFSPMAVHVRRKTCCSITVHWNTPEMSVKSSMIKRITARLFMKSKWGSTTVDRNISITSQDNLTVSYTFTELIPFTEYNLSMQSKPVSSMYWSDMTSVKVTTDSAVPRTAPGLMPSSFYNCTKEARYKYDGEYICILLKSIPEESVNSFFANYFINVTSANNSFTKNVDYRTVSVPLMKTSLDSVVYVNVRSYNDVGMSKDKSAATFNASGSPTAHLVLVNINSIGNYSVTWIVKDNSPSPIHSTIVFWCRETNGICTSSLGWKRFKGDGTKAVNVLHDKLKRSHLFAVGFITASGQSGGLVFATKDCEFSETDLDPFGTPDFTMMQSSDKMALDLEFEFKFCDFNDIPLKYNVFYIQLKSDSNDMNCTTVKATGKAEHIKADPGVSRYTIESLNLSVSYAVCMDVLLADNTTTRSSQVHVQRIISSLSNLDSENQLFGEWYIPIAVSGCLLLVVMLSVCARKCKTMGDVNVLIPDIRKTSNREDCNQNRLKHDKTMVYMKYNQETFNRIKIENVTKSLSTNRHSVDEGFSEGVKSNLTSLDCCSETTSSSGLEPSSSSAKPAKSVKRESEVTSPSDSDSGEETSRCENSIKNSEEVEDESSSSIYSEYFHVTIQSSASCRTSYSEDSSCSS